VNDFELFYSNYLLHNERLWEKYRKGQIRQEELRTKRMALALLDFKISDEDLTREMSVRFLELLPTRNLLFPGTTETLAYLSEKGYQLHLITNGFETTQHHKLRHSGIERFFGEVITSEGSNSLKPQKEIFEYAIRKAGARLNESIMIGDSIEVDIIGAYNAGLSQVHVNHLTNQPVSFAESRYPTYTVFHLGELQQIF
jgi:putative hydrolase of the HAD superfamily